MRRVGSWVGLACWAFVLSACGGGTADGEPGALLAQAPRKVALSAESFTPGALPSEATTEQVQRRVRRSPKPRPVALAAPSIESAKSGGSGSGAAGKPRRIGLARDVAPTQFDADTAAFLKWEPSARGGQVASISFSSKEAVGVRLGLLVRKMPPDAVVRVYSQKGAAVSEFDGSTITATIRRNVLADGDSDAARTFWTPMVEGEEVTLEIELAPGSPVGSLVIAVPRLSHVYTLPTSSRALESERIGEAASCQVDVACEGVSPESNATARMSYTVANGDSYACSGTLLTDAAHTGTPFFLSAYHCISRQSEASSLSTYWFYRASSCGSGMLSDSARRLDNGATLLYTNKSTDTAFMRLSGAPPAGVTYAGWDANTPSLATSITAWHHPGGDLQKVNRGSLAGFKTCSDADETGSYGCTESLQSGGTNHLSSRWSSGVTEGGSSGSGLFKTVGASRYLIGQLHGGLSSCTSPNGTDSYGRFDLAYNDGLKNWLDAPQRSAVYRFYNASTGAHFLTINAAERDFVVANYPAFKLEGVAFYAYPDTSTGFNAIYRFFNTRSGAHFYTSSEPEKNYVMVAYPDFRYEGSSWYAQASSGGDAKPLYRFYNASAGTHFYTMSDGERDFVIRTYAAFKYEGIAYYVWATAQ